MIGKPGKEFRWAGNGGLISTISASGDQDLCIIIQTRILTWEVGKAENPKILPNMRYSGTRNQAKTLLSQMKVIKAKSAAQVT